MFFRKRGQVVAVVAVNGALLGLNYKTDVQTLESLNVMYYMATIIPAVMFGFMGLVMLLMYGLGKKRTAELQIEKADMLQRKVEAGENNVGVNATQD